VTVWQKLCETLRNDASVTELRHFFREEMTPALQSCGISSEKNLSAAPPMNQQRRHSPALANRLTSQLQEVSQIVPSRLMVTS